MNEKLEVKEDKFLHIGIFLGLLAMVLAIVAIYLGYKTKQSYQVLEAQLSEDRSQQKSIRARYDDSSESVKDVEKQLGLLKKKVGIYSNEIGNLRGEVQTALNEVKKALATYNSRIAEINDKVDRAFTANDSSITASLENRKVKTDSPTGNSIAEPLSSFYEIQSGDYLSRIARAYGVTLEEILKLNPGIEPNRLQIGQKICVPE